MIERQSAQPRVPRLEQPGARDRIPSAHRAPKLKFVHGPNGSPIPIEVIECSLNLLGELPYLGLPFGIPKRAFEFNGVLLKPICELRFEGLITFSHQEHPDVAPQLMHL
jgi:hypothetical protein